MLAFNSVNKRFGKKIIVEQFSYQFTEVRYCIAGENGIGKTTLLLMAAGLEPIDSGNILLKEEAVSSPNNRKSLGISSDKILLPDFLTAQQLINFHCQHHQLSLPNELITCLHFSTQLNNKVSELSLGNSKKLSLILALAHQPQCLLLDEPSTGLDHDSRQWLLNYLTAYHGQIIVTSHEADFLNDNNYQQLNFTELVNTNIGVS
jgi:heme exporter protein A